MCGTNMDTLRHTTKLPKYTVYISKKGNKKAQEFSKE